MRAYELRRHDVISYYPPQPHKPTQTGIQTWRTHFY